MSRYQRLHGRIGPQDTRHVQQVFFLFVGLGTEEEFRLHGLDDSFVKANLVFRLHVLGKVLVPDVEGPLVITTEIPLAFGDPVFLLRRKLGRLKGFALDIGGRIAGDTTGTRQGFNDPVLVAFGVALGFLAIRAWHWLLG